ncbi:MAG: hypothetical protein KC620_00570 [Myxococcales bacterium]|nr:hypothetical protein [Myxococcales bacterium]
MNASSPRGPALAPRAAGPWHRGPSFVGLGLLFVAALALPAGCGEVETLILAPRPNQQDFPAAQAVMLRVGCGESFCHQVIQGNFRVTADPKTAAVAEDEFLMAKAFVDLETPENSRLLRVALQGAPERGTHPACFRAADDCAFRKLVAWIAWTSPDDPRPDDIDCPVTENACFGQ